MSHLSGGGLHRVHPHPASPTTPSLYPDPVAMSYGAPPAPTGGVAMGYADPSGFYTDPNASYYQPPVADGAAAYPQQPAGAYPPQPQQPPQQPYAPQRANPPLGAQMRAAGQLFDDLGFQNLGGMADNQLLQYGVGKLLEGGGQAIENNIHKYVSIHTLKYYFNVNTQYVMGKLKLLLFPVRHPSWKRRKIQDQAGVEHHLSPREDINAPDLYIPLMAFVTWVLVCAFAMGIAKRFSPEVLGVIATKGFVVMLAEVVFMKLGFYLLSNSFAIPILDIVAYCGYAFVGVVASIISGVFAGNLGFYLASLFTGLLMANFMVKTLRHLVLVSSPSNPNLPNQKRQYFILLCAALQLFINYSLGFVV